MSVYSGAGQVLELLGYKICQSILDAQYGYWENDQEWFHGVIDDHHGWGACNTLTVMKSKISQT